MVVKKQNKMKKRRPLAKQLTVARRKTSEMTRLGGALRALGGLGGRFVGSLAGYGTEGAGVGTGLGATLSRWLGSGDYTVSENTIVRQSAAGMVPAMHKEGQTVTVRHREFITEVTGKTAFTVQRSFSINPGLANTFPWLSSVAAQYSEYRIRGMVYHYVPTSGNAVSSTNAALGSVMLQTSYRANESVPTSKVEMLNEYWASEAKPSEAFCHPIECNPNENPFNVQYVRIGAVPSTDNVLLYDLGTTRLAVSGQQANDVVLGDLWVSYEIELRKPRLTSLNGEDVNGFTAFGTANVNNTTCFGTDIVETSDMMAGGATISSTALTIAPGNVGTYQMTLFYGAATSFSIASVTVAGAGSATTTSTYGSAIKQSATTTGAGAIVLITFVITNPNTTTVVTPTVSTLTGATSCTVNLTKINPLVTV